VYNIVSYKNGVQSKQVNFSCVTLGKEHDNKAVLFSKDYSIIGIGVEDKRD
jgi:hypothetical protein